MRWTALLVLVCATRVGAQERSLAEALIVPAEASCLTHEALVEHTRTWLGREVVDGRTSILVELGDGERHGVGFALLDGEEAIGRRTFPQLPESCADRRAAFSLALAIALDASVLDRLGAPAPEPPLVTEPEPPLETEPEPDLEMREDVRVPAPSPPLPGRSLHFDVAADFGVGVGLLPEWAWIGGLELALRGEGWQIRAAGRISSRVTSPIGVGRARAQLGIAELGGCIHSSWSVSVRACLGLSLGRLVAEGIGFDQVHHVRLWWGATTGELSAQWPSTGPVALRLGARGHVKWIRPTLTVQSAEGARVAENRLSIGGVTGFVGVVFALR